MDPKSVTDLYTVEEPSAAAQAAESIQARRLAERYRLEFVDMGRFNIDHELFRQIPADLMLRYGFVPYRRDGGALVIVVSDPTDLPMIDELAALLATPIRVAVGTPSAIQAILKKAKARSVSSTKRPKASRCRSSGTTRVRARTASPWIA